MTKIVIIREPTKSVVETAVSSIPCIFDGDNCLIAFESDFNSLKANDPEFVVDLMGISTATYKIG